MSRKDQAIFEALSRIQARSHRVVEQEDTSKTLSELVSMQHNVETLKLTAAFLERLEIQGMESGNMFRCLSWTRGMIQWSQDQCEEMTKKLPKEVMPAKENIGVGTMEISKGSPVLGTV